MNNGQYPRMTG